MVKKKSNGQSIIIVILCILLLISIGFGVTYSYYNGKSNLVKGTITTANLSIELHGADVFDQTAEFSISAPYGEEFLVPGNTLSNVKLNLFNKCNQKTYMVVVFALSAVKNDGTAKDVTDQLKSTPAIEFKSNTSSKKYVGDDWYQLFYQCSNLTDTAYTCLVGINPFEARGEKDYNKIFVFEQDSIIIPREWGNVLQNCDVTITVTAYAIQAENLEEGYRRPIITAEDDNNMPAKAQAIAKAVLEICKVDYAK